MHFKSKTVPLVLKEMLETIIDRRVKDEKSEVGDIIFKAGIEKERAEPQ